MAMGKPHPMTKQKKSKPSASNTGGKQEPSSKPGKVNWATPERQNEFARKYGSELIITPMSMPTVMTEELDHRALFDRAGLPGEKFDDDWIENVGDLIRSEGRLVGCQEWDSGGPGAGGGTLNVYLFRGFFISDNDVGVYGPYTTFAKAAEAVGLFITTDATTKIWVDVEFQRGRPEGSD
jgi:hypothetical protein